jgi:hypothetical protein
MARPWTPEKEEGGTRGSGGCQAVGLVVRRGVDGVGAGSAVCAAAGVVDGGLVVVVVVLQAASAMATAVIAKRRNRGQVGTGSPSLFSLFGVV